MAPVCPHRRRRRAAGHRCPWDVFVKHTTKQQTKKGRETCDDDDDDDA
jgi:hypothetical protein